MGNANSASRLIEPCDREITKEDSTELAAVLLGNDTGEGECLVPTGESFRRFRCHLTGAFFQRRVPVHQFEDPTVYEALRGKLRDIGGRRLVQLREGNHATVQL
jgi:hypothetical protein